ncbi:recombinase RecF [Zobellella denitrificans]|uniref:AAA family ATPase n=1 Tax=Zobellella denitrificans TaxID=347534 RepID=UPI000B8BF7C6|nr:AAA family ATPase [Zobellella denitrificans]OXS16966.1 recombinase RecF [Zobellella denitrificans]
MSAIKHLSISGFKSIRHLEQLPLGSLNVLIGANGAGKSNFVAYFRMLPELVKGRLQLWTSKQGGAERVLSYGIKETSALTTAIRFGASGYDIVLKPAADGAFTFAREQLYVDDPVDGITLPGLGEGHVEAKLRKAREQGSLQKIAGDCFNAISGWQVYHFHDTSDTAGVKLPCALHDNEHLREDAANLAAFLYRLQQEAPVVYRRICKIVRLAIPFFDDFVLKPETLATEEQQIRLLWRQKNNDYALWPSQLSNSAIRFICLVTALIQPKPPTAIIIDEPELGLHPTAMVILAELIHQAATHTQVIVATQSSPLLNHFSIADLIVVELTQGASVFKRLDAQEFEPWLEDYSVGELWEKNVLGGRP